MAGTAEEASSAKSSDYPCEYPEPIKFSQYEIVGRNGEPIKCDGAYLIFNLAFEHAVVWKNLKEEKYLQQFLKALGESWEIHPGIIKSENKRPFGAFPPSNDAILTEPVRDVLLGREVEPSVDMKTYVKNRLDPDQDSQYVEPLLFSFKDSHWIPHDKRSKTFSVNVKASKDQIETDVEFFLDWIDLWLFPDGSGMLSFKVLLADESTGQNVNNDHIHQIDRMNALIRELRDFKAKTQTTFPDGSTGEFWTEVFDKILGFDSEKRAHSHLLMSHLVFNKKHCAQRGACKQVNAVDYMDRYSRYCKVMIVAQTPDLSVNEESKLKWTEPLNDLPHNTDAIMKGSPPDKILSQSAIIAGYATVKDMIPFELATVSNHGSSVGWKDDPGWEYSREYIRSLMENNLIEVWEYWSALALRDTIAFVSYSTKVPIMWQAESRYYPLYVFCYHLRYQLDKLSEEIVDYDMSNARRGRRIRDSFQRFRNHYWFQEATKDFVGVEVFERMKKGMRINEVYDAVSNEISEVTRHLQEKWEGSIKRWSAGLAIFIWPSKTLWEQIIYPKIHWDQIGGWLSYHRWSLLFEVGSAFLILWLIWRIAQRNKELWVPWWMWWSESLARFFRRVVLLLG